MQNFIVFLFASISNVFASHDAHFITTDTRSA